VIAMFEEKFFGKTNKLFMGIVCGSFVSLFVLWYIVDLFFIRVKGRVVVRYGLKGVVHFLICLSQKIIIIGIY